MTTATTRQAIRRELYQQIGRWFAFSGTATGRTNSTLTHAAVFADSTLGPNHYRNWTLYMPDDAAVDQVRKVATHTNSTGVITQSGLNWATFSDLDYEMLMPGIHPDEVNACITRAQSRIYRELTVPLSPLITDGDMDASNTTSWSDVLTPTKSKVTTAAKVFSGQRALRVLNNAAGEGVQSTTVRGFSPNGGERVYVSAVVHADVGTAELHLYNVTGSSSIASVTSTEEGWVHLWLYVDLPASCEEIAVQLLGTEDTADIYWNHVVLYRMSQRSMALPSWVDEPWKLQKLREMRYTRSLDSQSNGGYDDATSRQPADWYQPIHFAPEPLHLDANPYAVQLMRPIPRNELWIMGKRPFSDDEALATDAATTLSPLRLLYAYTKEELAKIGRKRFPQDERWAMVMADAIAEVDGELRSRPEIPVQPLVRNETMGII